MKVFSLLTSSCIKAAQRHGIEDAVRRLAAKVEADQSITSWDKFLPSPFIKKSLGRDWRVVAERRAIANQDIVIICFVAALSRGGRDYSDFMDDPTTFANPLLPSADEISKFITERSKQPIEVLPSPSEIEYSYLYGQLNSFDTSDGVIYESKDWVKLISLTKGQLAWYYDLVSEAVNPANSDKNVLRKQNLLILYRYFQDTKSIFLVAPISEHDIKTQEELKSRYRHILNSNQIDKVELLKNSGRAYPAFVTADSKIWLGIQENVEANLALSPEESDILESVTHTMSGDEKIYPLFINGRPGSGKSTILQYLFAEHLHAHLSKNASGRLQSTPLYLTYSEKLLNSAKSVVKSLILCNSKLLLQGSAISEDELSGVFANCFAEFHKFLCGCLPPEKSQYFDPVRRIEFTEFRRRWNNKIKSNPDAELRKFSPELVWHVIRTYIKGMRDDENNYLDFDAYAELPYKQRTVDKTTYKKIYEKVWEGWYKPCCESEGCWDDQDLTRSLLDLGTDKLSNHPVVFCDEAQDFTKNELELILRLSLFSRRTLKYEDLKRVPFAFAGDPFQTLNPTGFDWGAVQASFHEKIVQELDRLSRSSLEFNYQELHYNYRSTKYIVGLCNLIQILRGVLFEVKDLKPQHNWFDEEAPPPAYFDIENSSCQEKLRDQSEMVIILPCQEGEETAYIENDPFLSQLAKDEVRNFLSPMSAKGLEFSRVVLYKFGDDYYQNYTQLLRPLETGRPHTDNPEAGLPLEYFVNRLYVAASRPKRRLFIVDTKTGIDKFWNSSYLKAPAELLKKYSVATVNGWKVDDLTLIQPGQEMDWAEDRDNSSMLGELFFNEGLATKDPYKLALAEANFRRAGQKDRELEARALRYEVEENYLESAKVYLDLCYIQKSLGLFWKAKAYKEILYNSLFEKTIEHRAASFRLTPKGAASCQSFLDFLYDKVDSNDWAKIIADRHWTELGDILLGEWFKVQIEGINWSRVYSQIKEMRSRGFEFSNNHDLAEIAFRARMYHDAIGIWEASPIIAPNNLSYKRAKAEAESFPKNVKWLVEIEEYRGAVDAYSANPKSQIYEESILPILNAHLKLSLFEEAVKFSTCHHTEVSLENLRQGLRNAKKDSLVLEPTSILLRIKLRAAQWKKAIDLIEKEKWNDDAKFTLQSALISELANSDALVEASLENRNYIADYLKKQIGQLTASQKIRPQTMGAAIERAGRIIDALAYYESIWKPSKYEKSAEAIFARERWAICKLRQAEYSRAQGKVGDEYRQKNEADKFAEQWKIDVTLLPTYPPITDGDLGDNHLPESLLSLSDEQVKDVKDLLKIGWSQAKIASTLKLPLEEVEKIRIADK